MQSYLELCVYPENIFNGRYQTLPAIGLHDKIEENFEIMDDSYLALKTKLEQSSRKICMMWHASEKAKLAESEFYSRTIKDAPALFGEDAIAILYHLEAMVLFARSAMDIASTVFGLTLPDPFKRKRYDSFNALVKDIMKIESLELYGYFNNLRENKTSWLSIIADVDKGRSLRDKLAHQTSFPISYATLSANTEKRHAVVFINHEYVPLEKFIDSLCLGIIDGFLELEKFAIQHIDDFNSKAE